MLQSCQLKKTEPTGDNLAAKTATELAICLTTDNKQPSESVMQYHRRHTDILPRLRKRGLTDTQILDLLERTTFVRGLSDEKFGTMKNVSVFDADATMETILTRAKDVEDLDGRSEHSAGAEKKNQLTNPDKRVSTMESKSSFTTPSTMESKTIFGTPKARSALSFSSLALFGLKEVIDYCWFGIGDLGSISVVSVRARQSVRDSRCWRSVVRAMFPKHPFEVIV